MIAPPPEHCPGTQSEEAGKASSCEGCPNQKVCQEAPKGPDPDLEVIRQRLSQVKRTILVLSGKGGVGKSTTAVSLARAWARQGLRVGVLDVDVCGPSVPRLLGLVDGQVHKSSSGWSPVLADEADDCEPLAVMSVGFLLARQEDAVIWRGPKKNLMIKQFLRDVDWGSLDVLVVDTPPGTSDEHLSVVSYLSGLAQGAVVVSTPQEVALQDVRKEIHFCRRAGIRVLGVLETMSGFECSKCKHVAMVFPANSGGAEAMAARMVPPVPFLASLPLDPRVARCCDEGESLFEVAPDSIAAQRYLSVAKQLLAD